jgi:hypothetical protein
MLIEALTKRRHHLEHGVERTGVIVPLLDDVLPPPLAIGVARRLGDDLHRITTDALVERQRRRGRSSLSRAGDIVRIRRSRLRGLRRVALTRECFRLRRVALFVLRLDREHVRRGEIHESDRHLSSERVSQRDPLRREHGERVVEGTSRVVRHVEQQRHRRAHVIASGDLHHFFRLRRTLDQDDVRRQRLERRTEAAGGAGTVVTDPEDVNGVGAHTSARQLR